MNKWPSFCLLSDCRGNFLRFFDCRIAIFNKNCICLFINSAIRCKLYLFSSSVSCVQRLALTVVGCDWVLIKKLENCKRFRIAWNANRFRREKKHGMHKRYENHNVSLLFRRYECISLKQHQNQIIKLNIYKSKNSRNSKAIFPNFRINFSIFI